MTFKRLRVHTHQLRTLLTKSQPDSFRFAFRFVFGVGLAFMGGMIFSHQFHETDRRIDESRVLREVGDRLAKELDLRLVGSATALRSFVARSDLALPSKRLPRASPVSVDMRLPSGVTALWLGSWPRGASQPVWIRSWEGAKVKRDLLSYSDIGVKVPEGSPQHWLSGVHPPMRYRIQMESQGGVGWFLVPLHGGEGFDADSGRSAAADISHEPLQNFILARVQSDFLNLAEFSKERGARGTSRMSFTIVPQASAREAKGFVVHSRLSVSNDIVLETRFRGDSVWLTQVEIEKNATWFMALLVALAGGGELLRWALGSLLSKARQRILPKFSPLRQKTSAHDSAAPKNKRASEYPSRSTSTVTPATGQEGVTLPPRTERKEVAVLYGRLMDPEFWTIQPKIAAQEVADTVYEFLNAVRESLAQESACPELRITEDGTFTAYYEVYSQGGGGFRAPLAAILSIRRALLRVNGLRKTDGHREVRVCMGLRTGVMVRDARHLPVRYIGIAFREAQDLARASGTLGVDCLIAPMGDPQRGEPLDQLAQEFLLKRVGEGRFKPRALPSVESVLSPVYVVEGTWLESAVGERTERPQIEGLYFAPIREQAEQSVAEGPWLGPTFELEKDMLTRNNIISLEKKSEEPIDSPQEKPVPKSEAS